MATPTKMPWTNDQKILAKTFKGMTAEQQTVAAAMVGLGANPIDARNRVLKYWDLAMRTVHSRGPKTLAREIMSYAAVDDPFKRYA